MSYLYNIYDTLSIRDGKVGIGTTAPRESFHVQGGSLYVERMTNVASNIDFAYSTLSNIARVRTDVLTTQSGTNINVDGKTLSNITTVSTTNITNDNHLVLFDNSTLSNISFMHVSDDLRVAKTVYASNLHVTGAFVTMDTLTSNTEQMTVTNIGTGPALIVTQTGTEPIATFYDDTNVAVQIADLGMVGIGTGAPSSKLHIYETSNVPAQVRMTNSIGDLTIGPALSASVYELFSTANAPLRIGTNSVEALRVATNGNIGVGTTTALYKLDVAGKTRVSDALYLRTGNMNTIFYSYGGHAFSAAGNAYIGMTVAWANTVSDNKLVFRVKVKCHLASADSVAYRKFETMITPADDSANGKPKQVVASEVADTNNNDFTMLTHTVTRNTGSSVDIKLEWSTALTSYIGNVQLEVFANTSLGDFTFTPISG